MASEVVESIAAALLDMSAVTDIVGTGDDAAIYNWLKEDIQVPATGLIVIELDSTEHMNDLLGRGGLEYHDVNLLIRGPKQSVTTILAEAIRVNGTDPGTGLAGYVGTPIDTKIDATLEDTVGPTPFIRGDGSANPYWDINMSFSVSQNEVA